MTYPNVRLLITAFLTLGVALPAVTEQTGSVEMSEISGTVERPRRHFRLRNPADLTPEGAEDVYGIVVPAFAVSARRSGHPHARAYLEWRRYNTAPYLSSTHGNHYVNNYANEAGRAYGRFEDAGAMPEGTVLAKDSFSVTETGGILLGPLFLMEKMAPGFHDLTGDWRYTLVQPDGTVLGETNGEGSERVEYCIGCHLAVEAQDHLYFIPSRYRVANP